MFQLQNQSQRHLTTAHLAQTMTLLSLTAEELHQKIESELASNPALEMIEERRCPNCGRLLQNQEPCPVCSRPKAQLSSEPIVFVSPREDFISSGPVPEDDMPEDNIGAATEDLPTFVLRQIAPELEPADRALAAYLLTHLDEDGLLTIPLIEVAQYHHVLPSRIENIKKMIQRAEPIGVGSATPQEAMLVQLEVLAETVAVPPLAEEAIRSGIHMLSRHQYSELAHLLKTNLKTVQEVANFIGHNLNPFPARSHWGDTREQSKNNDQVYHRPDIVINHLNEDTAGPLVVEIIMPISGTLRINPMFRQAIKEVDTEKVDDWKSDLERASLFVKCLQQRNHTMERLMSRIASLQKEFILHGEGDLKPITRAQLAKELEVHESTISRAVSNKAIQLPNGRIVPFAKFFDRSLHIRTALQGIIANETHPLSDTDLAELLAEQGYNVARRTVAKYRAMEGILPAHLRHATISRP
jgi:RNA polymerase sigma-54 factor